VDATRRFVADISGVADRLASEYVGIPRGSILRCVSRAVRRARSEGCPLDRLAEAAEKNARAMLERRGVTVPVQREDS
jgi:hypothetical protein